jgi:hypothetical protein
MNLNGAHLHLLINHIPVLGAPFGVALLLASLWRMNVTLQRTGLVVLVLTGLAAWGADLTGDPAKGVLRQQMAAEYPKSAVHEHEQAADYGLATSAILAVISLGVLWYSRRRPLKRGLVIGVIVAGLFVTSVLTRVAYLGGEVRHVEIRPPAP